MPGNALCGPGCADWRPCRRLGLGEAGPRGVGAHPPGPLARGGVAGPAVQIGLAHVRPPASGARRGEGWAVPATARRQASTGGAIGQQGPQRGRGPFGVQPLQVGQPSAARGALEWRQPLGQLVARGAAQPVIGVDLGRRQDDVVVFGWPRSRPGKVELMTAGTVDAGDAHNHEGAMPVQLPAAVPARVSASRERIMMAALPGQSLNVRGRTGP
jgi:hypothetical protein